MLAKFIAGVKRHQTQLKLAFGFSILIFVVHVLLKEARVIDWSQVRTSLFDQSATTVGVLVVLGIVAVCPMLFYDYTITRLLPGKFKLSYVLRSGWIVNSLTNLAGAGGVLGASLRAYFYKKDATAKQIIASISKIALFLVAGLSINCWLALAILLLVPQAHQFMHYWVWLAGGGLYFPAVFAFTKLKHGTFFADLTNARQLGLIIGSTVEWGCAAGFFVVIGIMLGVHTNWALVFMLYVSAAVIGVVSLLPGGLGSFDVLMLLEFSHLGIPQTQAVVWLLFFRIFYYFIPFVIGLALLVWQTGARFNRRFDGIPFLVSQKIAHVIVTTLLAVLGLVLLLEATLPTFSLDNHWLVWFSPYSVYFLNQGLNVVFAFALLATTRGIYAKVKRAYVPTLVILAICFINAVVFVQAKGTAVVTALMFLFVVCSKQELTRQSFRYSPASAALDIFIFAGVFLGYIAVGVVNMPRYLLHHEVPTAFLFPAENIWLEGLVGLGLALAVALLLIKYYTGKRAPFLTADFAADRVRHVIATYGGTTTSHLAFVRDKFIYFYQEQQQDKVFFMYRPRGDKLIVMGEPVGDAAAFKPALEQLMRDADEYGYTLVFYEVNEEFTLFLHEFGFDFLKSGEEGFVKLPEFKLAGRKLRGPRALMNKFERAGYQFELLQPPFSPAVMAQLRQISDEWLDGQVEKGFSLGYFDEYYLNQASIAVIKDADGTIIAFANLMPSGADKQILSIDLMRYGADAPSGIMDKMFVELFYYGQANGYATFNLGMAPLANVGVSNFAFLEERIEHLLYEYGTKLYGFQGLRTYKEKYVSYWLPKYTAYRKRSSLALTMLQLAAVVNERVTPANEQQSAKLWEVVANWLVNSAKKQVHRHKNRK